MARLIGKAESHFSEHLSTWSHSTHSLRADLQYLEAFLHGTALARWDTTCSISSCNKKFSLGSPWMVRKKKTKPTYDLLFFGEYDSRDGQWGLDPSRLTGWLFRVNHKTQAWSIPVSLRCLHYVSSCPGLRQGTFVTTQPPWQLLRGKSSKGPRETGS